MSTMTFEGHHANIEYDPELDSFRGEILGLNGCADFFGHNPKELRAEFKKSLHVFLEVFKESGIEPRRHYSGKFNLRISPGLLASGELGGIIRDIQAGLLRLKSRDRANVGRAPRDSRGAVQQSVPEGR